MTKALLPLCALLLTTLAFADYEYRYIEGETFNRAAIEGLRDEGFTSWMGHPSGGKVAVFGQPAGGFLEYDAKELEPGEYYLHFRCLALPTTKTHVLWDGQDLGFITHGAASTSLRWSVPVTVTGGGDHVLRLQGSEDSTCWPYIDVILLTNQAGYVPPAVDADFVSVKTAWPLLVQPGDAPLTLAPLATQTPAPLPDLRLDKLTLAPPVLGTNSVQLSVTSPTAKVVTLTAAFAGEGVGPAPATTTISLQEGVAQAVTLQPVAVRSAANTLVLSVRAGQLVSSAGYPVAVPAPATIALDEYAYPTTQQQGKWAATLKCAPELLPQMQLEVTLLALESGKTLWKKTVAAAETVSLPVDVTKMPVGRYAVSTQVKWNGAVAQTDRREFIIYQPVAFAAAEPVRTTRATGDTILLNGKPFLGRMLFHAPIEAGKRAQGYNLVHAAAGDPDPLPGIQQCLDACQKAGLYACVALFNNRYLNKGAEFDLAHVELVVNAVKNHPALWGWDLIDEPEFTMTPAAVQAGADLVRKLDPNHLVWVNQCQSSKMTDYLGSQDLWSYDFYPFPTRTPFSYKTDWLNLTDEKLPGKRPLGTCLQTFTFNRHQQRMTSPDELRTSAWLHIIHGYRFFGYYSYSDAEPAGCLSNSPELWSYTRALNTELAQLEDVILAPGQWQPVRMSPQTDKLEAREKKVGGKWYVVVVSDSKEPLTVKLAPTLSQGQRRLLIESDKPAVTGTAIKTTLRPFATQVWELTP